MDRKTTPDPGATEQVQGEGDYVSARKYQQEQHAFAENEGLVNKKAREAADALDGAEGEDIEQAREAAAQRGRSA